MNSFGRYEILEKLGAGGMAEVYLARAYGADGFVKDLVLKKVLANRAEDSQFRQMFVEEAKITVSLTHTNIVQVFDFGKVDDTYFLAMERVHGFDLRKLLGLLEKESRRIPVTVALYVIAEVLKGLDYAHRRSAPDGRALGIVHRDVSPSNILLSYEGEVKLADFGIARVAEKEEREPVTVIGKPRYMAPEQIRGESVDARADVFACGVVLAEMLLGEQPFAPSEDMDTFAMVLTGTTTRPLDEHAGIPRELVPVVKRAMATEASGRFASAAAFLKAIEDYAVERKIRLSAGILAELLHAVHPPPVAMTRPDPGPTRDVPTIFQRVSAGPGEVAHFTAQLERGGAEGAFSRIPTAAVDNSAAAATRRRRRRTWSAVAMVGLAGAGIGGAWQAGLVGPSATPTAEDNATPPATTTPEVAVTELPAATPEPTPVSTALAVAERPTPRRTAAPRVTPPPRPTAVKTPAVPASAPGRLFLNSIPWGHVKIDGKDAGTTPIRNGLTLPAGRHVVEIVNPLEGKSATFEVTIEAGEDTTRGVELK